MTNFVLTESKALLSYESWRGRAWHGEAWLGVAGRGEEAVTQKGSKVMVNQEVELVDGQPFFGGVPTAPQVEMLVKAFGLPTPSVITHEQIEAVIKESRKTSRYRTIVSAWRRRLYQENNIDSSGVKGVGVRILTEPERVDVTYDDTRRVTRAARKTYRRASVIDKARLDQRSLQKHDHVVAATAKIASAAVSSTRQLTSVVKATNQLPRLKAVE